MAAGLGFKDFTTGQVLTAADVNGYMASQSVMVFADSAARTAAITSPQEGMFSFLKNTDSTEYYTGAAWVAVAGAPSFNTGYNYVATGQSTTSSTYTDLATVQSVTVTTGTKALVMIQTRCELSVTTRQPRISFAVSGATTIAAADQRSAQMTCTNTTNMFQTMNYTQVLTGLTAGSNTFTMKFASPTADSCFFNERTISVVNLGS